MVVCQNPRFRRSGSVMLLGLSGLAALAVPCHGLTEYDFGNPTAEEQLYIEYINRARASPAAEGERLATTSDPDVCMAYDYFNVNLTMMQGEFTALQNNQASPVLPPLAPNASLTSSARTHSAWMLATATQSHDETNPANTPFSRMIAAGYSYSSAAENIYAAASSVWFGHAGFQVDWGSGSGGMQDPRGHRANIHSTKFREIGVGVALGTHGTYPDTVGPQLVTQDFGTSTSNPTFATGVAYYDLNANQCYDLDEGISGLTVNVSGADVTQYCRTAISGGWVVPAPATAATRTVTFSGLNINQSASLVIPASQNAKTDLVLTYAPPAITSSTSATADNPHTLAFTAVGGASAYQWNRWASIPAAAAENCESIANITSVTTGTYAVLNTGMYAQGSASFHLENSIAPGASQSIQLSPLYYGLTSPALTFQSCVRYATTSEQCKVQVREEGSLTWQDVFSQTGTNGAGESAFTLRSAALTAMAGKAFRVRFMLSYSPYGSYFGGYSGDNMGWFIDAIAFSGVATPGDNTSQTLTGTSGSFTPGAGATYLMSVAPIISNRAFPASYQMVTTTPGGVTPPVITSQPASIAIKSNTTTTLTVTASGTSPTFQWYQGTSPTTTSPIAGATGTSYTTPTLTSSRNYWVRATNAAGSANSNTAIVTIAVAPVITSQPTSIAIAGNTSATLTVSATGTSATFQWYQGSSPATTNPIAGATGTSFTTPALTTATNYWVRATNVAGIANSTTAAVTIATVPAITTHPKSTTINSGKTATLTVTATGTSATFQWYQGSSPATASPIAGATSASFTTPVLTSTVSYWVRVSNIAGIANSTTATVTVITPPVITTQPASVAIKTGTAATLAVVAAGPSLTYQWYKGTAPSTSSKISGATSASYTTPILTSTKTYWVRVTNTAGTANSTTAAVSMAVAPAIATQPASITVNSGHTAAFTVAASGSSPAFQWYAGAAGDTTNPVPGATAASFTTPALTSTTSYWVRASNAAGTANSTTATATVITPPLIVKQPVSTVVTLGGSTTLSVDATGSSPTSQWFVGPSGVTTNPVPGATTTTFTTPALTSTTSYWFRASNAAGTANSATATVTVQLPFAAWAANLESANGLATGTLSAQPGADYDHDGRSNLIEYAFGTSPVVASESVSRLPVATTTATHFVLTYQRDTTLTDLTFTAQACSTLGEWRAPCEPGAPDGFEDAPRGTGGPDDTIETRQAIIPRSSGSTFFMRLRITQP